MNTDLESRVRELVSKGNAWGAVTLLLVELKRQQAMLVAKDVEIAQSSSAFYGLAQQCEAVRRDLAEAEKELERLRELLAAKETV